MAKSKKEGRSQRRQAGRGPQGARHEGGPGARRETGSRPPGQGIATPDREALEALRRGSGLALDRDGRWLHEGRPIQHPRIAAVLHAGIDRHPQSGEYIVRVGREWAYVAVEDAPIVVRAAVPAGDAIMLRLSDGSEEPLDPRALVLGNGGALYTRVRRGSLPARFSRSAQSALLPYLEEEKGRMVLRVGGRTYAVAGPS